MLWSIADRSPLTGAVTIERVTGSPLGSLQLSGADSGISNAVAADPFAQLGGSSRAKVQSASPVVTYTNRLSGLTTESWGALVSLKVVVQEAELPEYLTQLDGVSAPPAARSSVTSTSPPLT